MKSLKKIIAVSLVFVTLFCVIPATSLADGEGNTYMGDSFWGWVLRTDIPSWLSDVVGFVSDDYCEDSPNHFHTANSYIRKTNFLESFGSLGYYDYECRCEYCGDLFYVNEKNVAKIFQDAYGTPATDDTEATGYVKQVEDELGTTIVGSSGMFVPISVRFEYSYTTSFSCVPGHDFFATGILYRNIGVPSVRCYIDSPETAPISGTYKLAGEINLVQDGGHLSPESGNLGLVFSAVAGDYFINKIGAQVGGSQGLIFTIDSLGLFEVSGSLFFEVTPLSSYDVNTYTVNIGGIDSRATSFTGDIGIMGDDGQLTKVDGDQIFNETTNNYYNPSTGTTSTVTDWTYDYSDRSYNLTLESGDTVTVTYGDENIIIQENDQTYTVYYIVVNNGSGSGGGDVGEDGHVHQWGEPTDSRPATCTDAGFETFTCSVCGETKTNTLPALGHKWKVKQSVQTKYDENGELLQQGYTIYECERCGEQYKSTDGAGPPGGLAPGTGSGSGTGSGEDDESIWSKLGKFLGTLGDGLLDFILALIGKVLDWLISLAEFLGDKLVAVAKVILDIFDFLPGLFTGFLTFLESVFGFLPTEIVTLLTFGIAAIVFIGIIKAIRR